jgi:hypothetical protein
VTGENRASGEQTQDLIGSVTQPASAARPSTFSNRPNHLDLDGDTGYFCREVHLRLILEIDFQSVAVSDPGGANPDDRSQRTEKASGFGFGSSCFV